MFVSFEPETSMFVNALDAVLAKELQKLAGRLNRWATIYSITRFIYQLRPPQEAFHTKITTIRRLIPASIRDLFAEYDYQIAAVWNNQNVTEIYYLDTEPDSDASYAFSNLSQTFS